MKAPKINQLTNKVTNAGIENFSKIKSSYKAVKVPKQAAVYDLVQISRKDGVKIDIITFKDKLGEIISRYRYDDKRWGVSIVESVYEKLDDFIDKKTGRVTQGRKITTYNKFKKLILGIKEEIQTVASIGKNPIIHISKISKEQLFTKPSQFVRETQSLYCYQKDKPITGYEIKGIIRSDNSYLTDVFTPQYIYNNVPEGMRGTMTTDPYLPLQLYDFDEFKQIAPSVARHPEHKTRIPVDISWYSDSVNDKRGGYCDDLGDVHLNEAVLKSRYDVITSAAHEKEHAYQMEQVELLRSKRTAEKFGLEFEDEKYLADVEKAKVYEENFDNYIESKDSLDEYYEQPVERAAREAGNMARQRFINSSSMLDTIFPYAPEYLFGIRLEDKSNYLDKGINKTVSLFKFYGM